VAVAHIGIGVVLTGVIAGFCTMMVMLLYLKLRGLPIIDRSHLTADDFRVEQKMSLLAALSPWIILIAASFAINFYPPWFDVLFKQMDMGVSVIQGQTIRTRMLWNAYTWVLVSTVLSAIFLRPTAACTGETLRKWLKRAPRPALAAAIFFAIAFVMNNSGFQFTGTAWKLVESSSNMIWVLAQGSAAAFGAAYPFISVFLGLFGGFVSGSEASTIAMFTKYHLLTSKLLDVDALIVTAATGIGGGLASVISPAKLQNAAATIDAIGIESQVIRKAFVISLIITTAAAVMALVFA
jgi:lactate permease